MKILSWNVNGLQARLETVKRLVADLQPDILCFQKVRKHGGFLIQVPDYMGYLASMKKVLFGGVSTYLSHGLEIDFEAQHNDIPEWLLETGCLNVIRFDRFILVNAYFPYANKNDEEFVKNR